MITRPASPVYGIIAVRTIEVTLLSLAAHWLWRWPLTGPHALGLFVTPLLCLYFVFVFVAPWAWGMPILTRFKTREPIVALTFDDGPSPETTPHILDILKAQGVKATFFVLGEDGERRPDLLRRIVAEGHTVGVHGFHHRALTLASWTSVRQELDRSAAAVRAACPETVPVFFRPPHGFKSLTLLWLVRRGGLRLVTWSLDPRDYDCRSSEQVTQAFFDRLRPGAIALLHDGAGSAVVMQALPAILDGLRERGYRCVPLTDQAGFGK